MGLFDKLFKNEPIQEPISAPEPSEPQQKKMYKEDFHVITHYNQDDIKKLRTPNPEYKNLPEPNRKCIDVPKYTYANKPVKLIEEPNNQYDPNAVMVMVAGEKVGYITSSDNVHVKDILKNESVKYISAFFYGGDVKKVCPNGDIVEQSDDVKIRVRIGYSK